MFFKFSALRKKAVRVLSDYEEVILSVLKLVCYIAGVFIGYRLSVRFLGPHAPLLQRLWFGVKLFLCLVVLYLGVCWFIGIVRHMVRDAKAICLALYDGRRVLSAIKDFDKSKLNRSYRYGCLSYDGVLMRQYLGPEFVYGAIQVQPGIQSIDEHAFDFFHGRNVRNILLPKSIRDLNIRAVLDGVTLVFEDNTAKTLLHGLEEQLRRRGITVCYGLFTEYLDVCSSFKEPEKPRLIPDHQTDYRNVIGSLSWEYTRLIVNAVNAIRSPEIVERAMDMVHEQMLSGTIAPKDFGDILYQIDGVDRQRYLGDDVIEQLYGSREQAVEKYARTFYESDNIRVKEQTDGIRTESGKAHRLEEIERLVTNIEGLRYTEDDMDRHPVPDMD